MADNTIANAIKFLKGEEKSLPATKTEGQVYFAYKNVGTAEKPSYTGAIYIDTPIGGTPNRVKMTANADIADKAFNDSAGLNIRETYLSSLGYTDDGKQTILIKGSGNNQTRIALPIASLIKSGIVTTDSQSFSGTKTFTAINSNSLTVTGSDGFNYSGIGSGTNDVARPVWFADNSGNGKPVVNTNFTYNPATQTLKVANLSGTADKATSDGNGQNIRNTYIKDITINNDVMTITKGSGSTLTLSVKDKLYSGNVITTKDDLDKFIEANVFKFGHINAIEGYNGLEKNDGIILSASWKTDPKYGHQIFIDDTSYNLRHRYRNTGAWSDWASILDSTNYNNYAPTKTGGGASGTWDISISGNAATATSAATINSATPTLSTGVEQNAITVKTNDNGIFTTETKTSNASIRSALDFKWYDTNWQIGNIRGGSDNSFGFGFAFKSSKDGTLSLKSYIDTNGVYHGDVKGSVTMAEKLQTARTITLAGSVIGSATFDGSDNIIITTSTNHSHSQYLLLTGGTMTGALTAPNITASNYFTTPIMIGEGDLSTYYHRVDFGHAGVNQFDFYEYGGIYNFYQNQQTGKDKAILLGKITSNGWEGNVKGNVTGNATSATTASSCTGNSATATALTSSAGTSTQPIYFSGGKPVACTYTLSKSVPADAKFTDTWRGIQNNLLSDSTTDSLSALQGKLLNEKIQNETYLLDNCTSISDSSLAKKIGTYLFKNNIKIITEKIGTYDGKDILQQTAIKNTLEYSYRIHTISTDGGVTWEKESWADLDTKNYTNYTVTRTGEGASGTWGISVSGSSASCTGNAATATKLQTVRTINGTSFDGSTNIITTSWGATRSFYIRDCNSSNTGTAVSVSGSSNVYLNMPASARFTGTVGIGNSSGATLNFYTAASTIGAKIVAYNDRIEFVFG